MCHRQTGRQTDGQMNRTDFIGPLPQRWRFDHVFGKFENKVFLNCEPYGKNQYKMNVKDTE